MNEEEMNRFVLFLRVQRLRCVRVYSLLANRRDESVMNGQGGDACLCAVCAMVSVVGRIMALGILAETLDRQTDQPHGEVEHKRQYVCGVSTLRHPS